MANQFEVLTRKDDLSAFNGGSLKGYVKTDFKTLCKLFGPPTHGPFDPDGDKVTCEWKIVTDDGLFITIYDWKLFETTMEEYDWHIGGQSFENVDWLNSFGLAAWKWR